MLHFVYYSFDILHNTVFVSKARIISEKNYMHPKQTAGDYFVYTMRNFSAKRNKMYVWRITDAFSSAFVSYILNKK
jgi:hypothetical protein